MQCRAWPRQRRKFANASVPAVSTTGDRIVRSPGFRNPKDNQPLIFDARAHQGTSVSKARKRCRRSSSVELRQTRILAVHPPERTEALTLSRSRGGGTTKPSVNPGATFLERLSSKMHD